MSPAFHDPDAGREVARHVGIDLTEVTGPGGPIRIVGNAPAPDAVRDNAGVLHSGIITALADIVAGITSGLASLPRWIVSTDLLISRLRTEVVGPIGLEAEVLRVGRTAAVTRVRATDDGAGGALVADGVLTASLLAPDGGPPDHPRPFRMRAIEPAPGGPPPLAEFFRLTADDPTPGEVRLDLAEHLRNPWGILHGGATAVLVAAAAEHAARRELGGRWYSGDTALHYLRPARTGPVVGRARVLGSRPDGAVVAVTLRDAGAADRVVAEAVVTVRRT
ncbi:MAG: hotdog domain-containing protein [Actinomycetes bacterium]